LKNVAALRPVQSLWGIHPQAQLFLLGMLALSFVVDGLYNVLLNLFLLRLGYSTELIGLVNAAGLLSFALASFLAGLLGTRIPPTYLMKAGAWLCLVGGGLLPWVEALPPSARVGWLLSFYVLMLGGFALFFVSSSPFLMNIVERAHKQRAFALKTAYWSIAGFFGSLSAGLLPTLLSSPLQSGLDTPAPYRLTLTVATCLLVLALFIILRIAPLRLSNPAAPTTTAASAAGRSWARPVLAIVLMMTVIRLFQVSSTATVLVYFNVYMDQQLAVSTLLIGAVAALGRLAGLPAALLTPRLVQRWGNAQVILWGSLFSSLCLLPLALVEHWLAAALSFVASLALTSLRYTAFVVYVLELVPRAQQSLMAGSGEMAAGLSFALMALGGGLLLSLFAFRDLFLLSALLSFVGTVGFWLHMRSSSRAPLPVVSPGLR